MDTPFICQLCFNKYKTQKTIDRHLCKSKIDNINCQYCSKSFTRLTYKNNHETKCQNNPNIHMLKQINNIPPTLTDMNNLVSNSIINPNNYGYENLDYITDEQLVEMISKKGDGVIRMILLKHFNKLHPENHNVIVNGDNCIVYKNDKWKNINRDALVGDLYYDGINSIDVIYEESIDNNKSLKVKDSDIDFLKYDYEDGDTMALYKEKLDDILSKNRNVSKILKINTPNTLL